MPAVSLQCPLSHFGAFRLDIDKFADGNGGFKQDNTKAKKSKTKGRQLRHDFGPFLTCFSAPSRPARRVWCLAPMLTGCGLVLPILYHDQFTSPGPQRLNAQQMNAVFDVAATGVVPILCTMTSTSILPVFLCSHPPTPSPHRRVSPGLHHAGLCWVMIDVCVRRCRVQIDASGTKHQNVDMLRRSPVMPIIVFLRIGSSRVLSKLLKSREQQQGFKAQMNTSEKLSSLNPLVRQTPARRCPAATQFYF